MSKIRKGIFSAPLPEFKAYTNKLADSSKSGKTNYDVVVIGVGSMGAASCHYLTQAGIKVLGIEQFDIPHEFGSHAGQSRIIRQAYFEHPDYVPLLKRAYENWSKIESLTDSQLVFKTGLLYMGKPHAMLVKGVRNSAELYQLPIETLSNDSDTTHYSQFKLPASFDMLFEKNAGFVTPEKSILSYTTLALQKGCEIHSQEKVINWKTTKDGINVKTNKNSYSCDKLVITAGPWAKQLVPDYSSNLTVTRQLVSWVNPSQPERFNKDYFPCWTLEDEEQPGIYYGFPMLNNKAFGQPQGLKIGHHTPGQKVDLADMDRTPKQAELDNLVAMMEMYMPNIFNGFYDSKICLYTNTPDENFIIDFMPEDDNVLVATGFSGHGFKFSSVIGEILSDLTINGRTPLPIEFLSYQRLHDLE